MNYSVRYGTQTIEVSIEQGAYFIKIPGRRVQGLKPDRGRATKAGINSAVKAALKMQAPQKTRRRKNPKGRCSSCLAPHPAHLLISAGMGDYICKPGCGCRNCNMDTLSLSEFARALRRFMWKEEQKRRTNAGGFYDQSSSGRKCSYCGKTPLTVAQFKAGGHCSKCSTELRALDRTIKSWGIKPSRGGSSFLSREVR